jgi:protoheme ferro-lyase
LILLLIVGYPTETKQDFEFTKKWFEDRKHYAQFPVKSVVFSLASILPNTELDRKKKDYNITQGEIPTFWISNATQVSTQDRLDYHDTLTKLLFKLKFSYNLGDGTTFKATKQEILL